jgi:PTH1 family peptidyl-tRNA hydrolase
VAYVDALIVGLGNPGARYAATRHNIGWRTVERICTDHRGSLRGKYDGRYGEIRVGETAIGLLTPETFMNDSGRSVAACVRDLRVPIDALIVVYDDIELAPGRVRARRGGGLKGHNGLRSLAGALGSPEFLRVRCGVGRPGRGDPRDIASYVLAPFEADEDPDGLAAAAADCAVTIACEGIDAALEHWP